MQLSGPCSCVGLASMLRQACGQGQKVDLAAQKGTLLGQQEACQESFFGGVIICYPYIFLRGGGFFVGLLCAILTFC